MSRRQVSRCQVSRCLTTLVPQRTHRTAEARRFPWSKRFDHIFRNEEVTGSNPVSSTQKSSITSRRKRGSAPRRRRPIVW
jgi:hypothetical protein